MVAQSHRTMLSAALRFLVATAIVLATGLLIYSNIADKQARIRGIETGGRVTALPPASPALGTDLALSPYASQAQVRAAIPRLASTGLTGFCQAFSWDALEPRQGEYDWSFSDSVIKTARGKGLQVVAILNRSPYWARGAENDANPLAPPADLADYAAFCAAFAERYAGDIAGYQIWDQPNISPNWGDGPVQPAEYVQMLAAAAPAIRHADPRAVIIGGGLAPTTESGGLNLSDVAYLQEIYRRGAGDYMDVLGAKAYGFWTGPYDRTVDEQTLNFSRLVLLRKEMLRRGDEDKPVWITGGGWVALDESYSGRPSPLGSDSWAVQSSRLQQAVERMRAEWPWVGYACLQTLQPPPSSLDPRQGLALYTSTGQRTPLGDALASAVGSRQMLSPGITLPSSAFLSQNMTGEFAEATMQGTGLWLQFDATYQGGLAVAIDQLHTDIAVDAPREPGEWVRVTSGLSPGEHALVFQGDADTRAAIRAVRVSNSYVDVSGTITLTVGVLVLIWMIIIAVLAARMLPWKSTWSRLFGYWQALPVALQWTLHAAFLLAALGLSGSWFAPVAVAGYAVICLFRPWEATCLAAAAIPFAPLSSSLMVGQFGITEITLLCATAALVWNLLLGKLRLQGARLRQLRTMDWLVIALVVVAAISALLAEYQHVAWREFRVTIAESALLYALIRLQRTQTDKGLLLIDLLWGAGTLMVLYALAVYPTSWGVVEAEGVRRARAFYGSPNNLALMLERLWPMGVAMAIWGRDRWRRWTYGTVGVLMLLSLLLTFSRGAIFFGAPAAVVVLGMAMDKRWRIALLAVLAAGLIVAIPVIGPDRLGSMLDPRGGTTGLRVALWQASARMIQDHPVLGVGPDNFLYYYGDYILESAAVDPNLSHPHNLLLDFWLRLGILGPALLAAILILFVKRIRLALEYPWRSNRYAILLGMAAGMAAALLHGLGDAFFFVIELAMWFMLVLAWTSNEGDPAITQR